MASSLEINESNLTFHVQTISRTQETHETKLKEHDKKLEGNLTVYHLWGTVSVIISVVTLAGGWYTNHLLTQMDNKLLARDQVLEREINLLRLELERSKSSIKINR